MKPKVVVYRKVYDEVLERLAEACEVVYRPQPREADGSALYEALGEAQGLLGSGLRIDEALLERSPQLRAVANFSAGYENLDLEALQRRGVTATNTPGVLNDTVADCVMALMLAAGRRVSELDRAMRAGQWTTSIDEEWFGVDVHHRTLGIIGMGEIGQAVAKRARLGFDMRIVYHNRSRNETAEQRYEAQWLSLEALLEQSDYVCMLTPLTPQTERMIGAAELACMKPTGIFLNASRGRTVDEAALIEALRERRILAAGLDVFEQEPLPADSPLLQLDNVVCVPHIGSATHETRLAMQLLSVRNLLDALRGETPPNRLV
ncbi:D-glycerate dehydrogenase [Paenibacillus sp. IB182496]|uniref:Glyoxylate/hydroxypyruvate reductase B n=1 Tax=Paenibacillus sabuli TaxID=2772509 RepID=A0A927BSR0_9BACL|nr:D-glycerate dehydrogenase [Paenibacillus sabuli]MBD2844990.1 D-glycerate dehydrogenase [Paenibacillus sabuli]